MTQQDQAVGRERTPRTRTADPWAGGLRGHAPRRPPDGRGARPADGGDARRASRRRRSTSLAYTFAMDHGAYPASLLYRGYPKSICTSINHVVCHGIPNDKPLREGDIVNIDVCLILDGWHGDSSRMAYVGEVPRKAARLCEITYECLMRGIAAIKPGRPTTRHRRGDPGLRRGRALLGGARFLRPRPRPRLPRRADHPALRRAELRRAAASPACSSPSSR